VDQALNATLEGGTATAQVLDVDDGPIRGVNKPVLSPGLCFGEAAGRLLAADEC